MNVVDELFPHHDDEELLSQLDQTAPWTTLQSTHTRRTNHTFNHTTHKCTEQMSFAADVISTNVLYIRVGEKWQRLKLVHRTHVLVPHPK